MDFKLILEVLGTVAVVASVGFLMYYYFKSEKVKKVVSVVLPVLPAVFGVLSSQAKDKKGVFDYHDAWVLLSRVSDELRRILNDRTNVSFEDVEDDVVLVINKELEIYRAAGVKNVPSMTDPAIRASVKVVFEQIKRALDEQIRAGSN